ncbi:glucan endo-1,3-beta-glucosidase 6-like [Vigna radiata var. radiata]|uniref:glucan endo-1,3-beta-D-glucosidase n=1 Tax=Vigna radiata var. radiata TaxID=3916 RepID=A0A1S3TV40_VIGRR|nr:glucan endo-1,3-beta-glucosidase 6-like [Vigna radiata var. radiata]
MNSSFMWAFCMILVMALSHFQGGQGEEALSDIGVNWGAMASQPLYPPVVVNLLKENGISRIKLFDADPWTVSAFSGSNIEVMVGIPNEMLKKLSKDKDNAEDWVKHNVSKQVKGGVDIRYISVGNEPFLKSFNGSYVGITLPAMKNVQRALKKAGLGDKIKVTSALNADVYESATDKPSDGKFRKDIYDVMEQIVSFLDENKSPFLVNIYPFLSLYQNDNFPKDYAFFDGNAKGTDDKNVHYSNMFDANLDTLVWSLKKTGHPNVTIVIGEVGWPTDGDKNANGENAKRFYQGFLKRMANKKGSPLHPKPMITYLFSLTDENQKSIAPGDFERHWGIFTYDGKPKFSIDFSGKGQDKKPIAAKGVSYQEHKWCVLKQGTKQGVQDALAYACSMGDCSSLGFARSCADLTLAGNVSYAFNQYFQINDQSVEACDFNGLAEIVQDDPSKGNCRFPIALMSSANILKAMQHLRLYLIGFTIIFTFCL